MANKAITEQLTQFLTKSNAHVTFDEAVKGLSFENLGKKPANLPYSIWMLVEHIRIVQTDILDFSINPGYKELDWPKDYWPQEESPKDESAWQASLQQIARDRETFISILEKTDTDLFSPFAHGHGENFFREALLIADHNSYHTGEIVLIRRLLNDWK